MTQILTTIVVFAIIFAAGIGFTVGNYKGSMSMLENCKELKK